jgi:hypothetical protein
MVLICRKGKHTIEKLRGLLPPEVKGQMSEGVAQSAIHSSVIRQSVIR